jgi:hypothetical protein
MTDQELQQLRQRLETGSDGEVYGRAAVLTLVRELEREKAAALDRHAESMRRSTELLERLAQTAPAAAVVEQVKDFIARGDRMAEFVKTIDRAARVVEQTPFAEGTHTGLKQIDLKRRAAAAIRALEFEP